MLHVTTVRVYSLQVKMQVYEIIILYQFGNEVQYYSMLIVLACFTSYNLSIYGGLACILMYLGRISNCTEYVPKERGAECQRSSCFLDLRP